MKLYDFVDEIAITCNKDMVVSSIKEKLFNKGFLLNNDAGIVKDLGIVAIKQGNVCRSLEIRIEFEFNQNQNKHLQLNTVADRINARIQANNYGLDQIKVTDDARNFISNLNIPIKGYSVNNNSGQSIRTMVAFELSDYLNMDSELNPFNDRIDSTIGDVLYIDYQNYLESINSLDTRCRFRIISDNVIGKANSINNKRIQKSENAEKNKAEGKSVPTTSETSAVKNTVESNTSNIKPTTSDPVGDHNAEVNVQVNFSQNPNKNRPI